MADSLYVGRILQHLNARIEQHVPLSLHLLSSEARVSLPRRGRRRRLLCQMQPALTLDTECDAMAKVGVRRGEITVGEDE